MEDMRAALQALLFETRPFFFDEAALADSAAKGRADYVTRCDTGVQRFLQTELARRWPDVQFLGEEGARGALDEAGRVFVLDPVDGTANLMHHLGHSAVSLALVESGEMFAAQKGAGAFCNGRPLRASAADGLAHSVVAVGTSPYDRQFTDANFALFRAVYGRCEDIRRSGSAALDLAYVAAGRLEGYFERNLKPWDFAAGMLLAAEAGALVSGWDGGVLRPLANADVLAAAPAVYGELRALTAQSAGE